MRKRSPPCASFSLLEQPQRTLVRARISVTRNESDDLFFAISESYGAYVPVQFVAENVSDPARSVSKRYFVGASSAMA